MLDEQRSVRKKMSRLYADSEHLPLSRLNTPVAKKRTTTASNRLVKLPAGAPVPHPGEASNLVAGGRQRRQSSTLYSDSRTDEVVELCAKSLGTSAPPSPFLPTLAAAGTLADAEVHQSPSNAPML